VIKMAEWNINTVSKAEYMDEMSNLVNQIPKNVDNIVNLIKIKDALSEMVEEIKEKGSTKVTFIKDGW